MAHNFTATDVENGDCTASVGLTLPNCSVPCSITNLTASSGEPTVHTVEVADFEFLPADINVTIGDTVRFVWTGVVPHTSTSDATTGPLVWDSGLHGLGFVYDVVITEPGTHGYYCVPHGAPGGIGMAGTITALPNCTDGQVSVALNFNTENTGTTGFNVYDNGTLVSGSPFAYGAGSSQSANVFIGGDGTSHTITVSDAGNNSCVSTVNITTPDCSFTPPCVLNLMANITGACNTTTQQVPVMIHLESENTGTSGFNLYNNGALVSGSPFAYQASGINMISLNLFGDGAAHTFTATDVENSDCSTSITVTLPNCSVPCSITNLTASSGEPTVHTVEVADFEFIPADINVTIGDTVRFVWTGVVPHTSTSDATTGPLVWNSGLEGQGFVYDVVITEPGTHGYYCVPHGAPGGIGMAGTITALPNCTDGQVSVALNFNTENTGTSGFNVYDNGTLVSGSPFTYDAGSSQSANVLIEGDGNNHVITVMDLSDSDCEATVNITTPDCSFTPPCSLNVMTSITGRCNASLQVPVTIYVESANAGTSGFNLYNNGALVMGSPFAYNASGITLVNLNLNGDGAAHNFTATDVENTDCTASTSLTLPNCSVPCSITNLTASSGEPTVHTVQVEDFEFSPADINVTIGDTVRFVWTGVVPHTSTSDATTGPLVWDSGLEGQGFVYDVVITEPGTHGYYCIPHGAPGGIGMAGTITAMPNCTDGQVSVALNFNTENTGTSGFNVYDNGTLVAGSPFTYDAGSSQSANVLIEGDGTSHTITVSDAGNSDCEATTSITTPDCSFTPPCSLNLMTNITGGCNASLASSRNDLCGKCKCWNCWFQLVQQRCIGDGKSVYLQCQWNHFGEP